MTITKLSSREFNQETGRAKKAARKGPVFITDRGRPAHALLTYVGYQRLTSRPGGIVEMLGAPAGIEDVELNIPPLRDVAEPADLH
jgi:hypothetical protein